MNHLELCAKLIMLEVATSIYYHKSNKESHSPGVDKVSRDYLL